VGATGATGAAPRPLSSISNSISKP
jgi:hypothetical protein